MSRAAKRLSEQAARSEAPSSGVPSSKEAQKAVTRNEAVQSEVARNEASRRSLLSRSSAVFPKFMRTYAERIKRAPLSHVVSFFILHELSAIIPLFAVWGAFYYFDYVPVGVPQWLVEAGAGFIRRLAERNGWTMLAHADTGSRLLLQGAAAYALVKTTLPLRLVFSVWAMPFFARWVVIPVNTRVASVFKHLVGAIAKKKS